MLVDKYRLYIFDWDGTLSTSTPVVKLTRFLKQRYDVGHIKRMKKSYTVDKISYPRGEGRMSRTYEIAYFIYSLIYKPRLKPGALELLKLLKKKGKKVALFSDSNRHRLAIETRKLGITPYFDLILSADTIKRLKPNPTGIALIMSKLGIGRRACLYIGDMASDVFTAKYAGVKFCAVADGVDSYELLKSLKPNYIVEKLGYLETAD